MHFKTVREILVSSVPEECKNLIVESSITSRIKTETLPNDIIVHSYRGSTTEEKIRVLNRYLEQKIKCVTLQDGTNCILEQKIASPDETINKFLELIEVSTAQYSPDMVAICKKPPIINNHEAKVDIDELINAINENFGSRADFEVLNLNSLLKNLKNKGPYNETKSTSMIITASLSYVAVCVILFLNTLEPSKNQII